MPKEGVLRVRKRYGYAPDYRFGKNDQLIWAYWGGGGSDPHTLPLGYAPDRYGGNERSLLKAKIDVHLE